MPAGRLGSCARFSLKKLSLSGLMRTKIGGYEREKPRDPSRFTTKTQGKADALEEHTQTKKHTKYKHTDKRGSRRVSALNWMSKDKAGTR